MNRNQVLKIIADHRETLARDFGVKSLALFGSVVRNEASPGSDVDLLVESPAPTFVIEGGRTQHVLYLDKSGGLQLAMPRTFSR